ncbi:MAG TPA: hypothetical protein VMS12_06450 [Thermoanaerobaculia bacterium]|nr:hypothetical protein [Thermoanaerobaculia bacterium]
MRAPTRLLLAPGNRLFVSDSEEHSIFELALSGDGLRGRLVRRYGTGEPGLTDGPAPIARFHDPRGMSYWRGTMYVADSGNHAIRAIDLQRGEVRTVAGTGEKGSGRIVAGGQALFTPMRSPRAVWADGDALLIALAGSHQIGILMDESVVGPFAGNGQREVVDGPRGLASFIQPYDLSSGLDYLFVADRQSHTIRAVSLEGEPMVSTLAGQPEPGDLDGVSDGVRLHDPSGIVFHQGVIYISDSSNNRIKRLDPSTGSCESLIGNGHAGFVDGAFATSEFHAPEGLSIESGLLYIADVRNRAVRVANLKSETVHTFQFEDAHESEPAFDGS